jgi:sugar O-acyltransferase (sialic acid O-acetyltransferase NeuD family)
VRLFIYCAGGFGREILDVARRANARTRRWTEVALVDDAPGLTGTKVHEARVVAFNELANEDRGTCEFVIGHGEPALRRLLLAKVDAAGFRMGQVIDESSIVSAYANVADGAVITPYCSVAVSARLGRNVALNTKAIIGHDIEIGDNCVISSLVNVGGACVVGADTYIGMGSSIKEGLKIGREVIVGMGSVVHHDIPDGMIAMGNPARPIRRNEDKRVFGKSNGGNRV